MIFKRSENKDKHKAVKKTKQNRAKNKICAQDNLSSSNTAKRRLGAIFSMNKAHGNSTNYDNENKMVANCNCHDESNFKDNIDNKLQASPKSSHFYAPVVVYTVEELERAQKNGVERILVEGELAKKLKVALKALRSIGAGSLNTLALCLSGAALLAPFTGGVTLGAAGTAMGTLGAALTATAIAAISAIGFALVIAVFKGYDEVRLGGGGVELVIKKHKDNNKAQA